MSPHQFNGILRIDKEGISKDKANFRDSFRSPNVHTNVNVNRLTCKINSKTTIDMARLTAAKVEVGSKPTSINLSIL